MTSEAAQLAEQLYSQQALASASSSREADLLSQLGALQSELAHAQEQQLASQMELETREQAALQLQLRESLGLRAAGGGGGGDARGAEPPPSSSSLEARLAVAEDSAMAARAEADALRQRVVALEVRRRGGGGGGLLAIGRLGGWLLDIQPHSLHMCTSAFPPCVFLCGSQKPVYYYPSCHFPSCHNPSCHIPS